jgi:type VI secretion system protein ImpH
VSDAAPVTSKEPAAAVQPADASDHPAVEQAAQRTSAFAYVERALREDATSFQFFQAVRLLERLSPDHARPGQFVDPARVFVRLGVFPHPGCPPSEIRSLDLVATPQAALSDNFLGLTGPSGVLPYNYTLLLADRYRARDRAAVAFLDLFHHRAISLFYEAWRKYRLTVALETGTEDRLADHLLDIAGVGLENERATAPVSDRMVAFYAGLLAPVQRSAVALEQWIEDFFGVPAEIEQFVGGWYPLPRVEQTEVGGEALSDRLGRGAVAGDEIWDPQARVRVRLGPLSRQEFERFLPTGPAYEDLVALTRFFAHDQFDFEVQLVLAREEVPGVALGDAALPLGWSTWIRTRPFARNADDTVLTLRPITGEAS